MTFDEAKTADLVHYFPGSTHETRMMALLPDEERSAAAHAAGIDVFSGIFELDSMARMVANPDAEIATHEAARKAAREFGDYGPEFFKP